MSPGASRSAIDQHRPMLVKPSRRLRKHLERHGRRARATVLEISNRGWNEFRDERGWDAESHSADPMRSWCRRETRIRVAPEGAPELELEAKLTFRLLTLPEAGAEIDVIYDPDDPGKVVVDEGRQLERAENAETEAANAAITEAGYDPETLSTAVEEARSLGSGTERPEAPDGAQSDLISEAMESARKLQAELAADPEGALRSMQAQQLEQLSRLKEQGMLSEAQFEDAKSRLLG